MASFSLHKSSESLFFVNRLIWLTFSALSSWLGWLAGCPPGPSLSAALFRTGLRRAVRKRSRQNVGKLLERSIYFPASARAFSSAATADFPEASGSVRAKAIPSS